MVSKTETQAAVQEEFQRRDINRQAAVLETRKLVKAGWIILIIGWIMPIIPILGYFLMIVGEMTGLILGIVTIVKGNTKGGLILLLASIFITIVVWLIWVAIWSAAIFGALTSGAR